MKKNLPLLLALFAMALFLRTYELGSVGLSEDEANKALSVEDYLQGNFSTNAEHPMFMKTLCTISMVASRTWNAAAPAFPVSPEAAVRFPIALAGSLGVFAIFLLGSELLGTSVALIAALLWAVDPNVIALTRIAKEDGLVTLFYILASYFLIRGKRLHFTDREQANRMYLYCGAAFGAFFASKYLVPLVWVTLVYYDLFRFRKEPRWRLDRKTSFQLCAVATAVFLVLNPAILMPSVWRSVWSHFIHAQVPHDGYFMIGRIFLNKTYYTFWGQPLYYFLLYLWVKTPVPLLISLCVGFVYMWKRRRDDSVLFLVLYFLVWLFLLSFVGGKFTRYEVTWHPAVALLEALGIYTVYALFRAHFEKRMAGLRPAGIVLGLALFSTAGWSLIIAAKVHPVYSLYVTSQAGGDEKRGYYFPQDDFYDAGLREAIAYVAKNAPTGAEVVGTTPAAFQYYSQVYKRPDLKFIKMWEPQIHLSPGAGPYVLYQESRQYFQTQAMLVFFRAELNPLYISRVKNLDAVTVYRLSCDPGESKSPYWRAGHWGGRLSDLNRDKNGRICSVKGT